MSVMEFFMGLLHGAFMLSTFLVLTTLVSLFRSNLPCIVCRQVSLEPQR